MKKKILLLLAVAFLVVSYGVIFYFRAEVRLEIPTATKITVFSGSNGQSVEIVDEEAIRSITENLNGLSFRRGKSSRNYEGYAYELTFYDAEGDQIALVKVMSRDRISCRDRFLHSEEGSTGVDTDYLERLFSP